MRLRLARPIEDALAAALLAPQCASCSRALEHPSQSVVCGSCWEGIRPLTPPLCAICGDPLPSWRVIDPDERCIRCRAASPCIARGRAVAEHAGVLRALLHALKYDGRRSIAPQLSALMRQHGRWVLDGADCCVPVPLHWRRLWRRGFNQAAELAAGLPLPVVTALRRRRPTLSQADLPAGSRRANVRGAFCATRASARAVRGACVVVVDDVSTTGATLEACAMTLLEAGAREVRALTAARVVTRQPGARRR
jgi:ComF family protein